MWEMPHFTIGKVLYTAIGASVFWGISGRTKLRPFYLFDFVKFLPLEKKTQDILQFIVFIVLGCVVGIGFADPNNPRQALTAGFGWTGVFARRKHDD